MLPKAARWNKFEQIRVTAQALVDRKAQNVRGVYATARSLLEGAQRKVLPQARWRYFHNRNAELDLVRYGAQLTKLLNAYKLHHAGSCSAWVGLEAGWPDDGDNINDSYDDLEVYLVKLGYETGTVAQHRETVGMYTPGGANWLRASAIVFHASHGADEMKQALTQQLIALQADLKKLSDRVASMV
jgi:hypothetical protein